jgi:hypothetical protein
MWLTAQETVKELIRNAGGRLQDHVAFCDAGPTLATLVTTPRWMLTGRRDAFLGLPAAGIAEREIASAGRFGRARRALLRRRGNAGTGPLVVGDVVVDARRHVATRAGRDLELTRREFDLLEVLALNAGIVLTRPVLLERVWGYERLVETRSVDVHVGRLRSKLGSAGGQIETVVGLGYRFTD